MKAPAWIQMPLLTKREGDLFQAWQEEVRQAAEKEGRKLDLYGEGYPLLLALSHEHFPKLGRQRRIKLLMKLSTEFQRSLRLYYEAAGSA